MIHLNNYDPIIPKEVMQKNFGNLDILLTGSVSEAIRYNDARCKRGIRLYTPQNMKEAEKLEQELKEQVIWFRSFDDIGIPNCRFDQSIDMWGRRELVNEWALLITKGALPETSYMTIDEHGADRYSIKKKYIDHLAQFTKGDERPLLYLALSEKKADREIAKKIVDRIYERFQSKRDRKVKERIGIIEQILNLDYLQCDYKPAEPAKAPVPEAHERRSILQRIFSAQ